MTANPALTVRAIERAASFLFTTTPGFVGLKVRGLDEQSLADVLAAARRVLRPLNADDADDPAEVVFASRLVLTERHPQAYSCREVPGIKLQLSVRIDGTVLLVSERESTYAASGAQPIREAHVVLKAPGRTAPPVEALR